MQNTDTNNAPSAPPPEPEALSVVDSTDSPESSGTSTNMPEVTQTSVSRRSYRPSHKATFIGIAVMIAFLAANVAGIMFLMRSEADAQDELVNNGVTLSAETLSELGVSREPLGEGVELTVGPNSTFRGNLTVGENVSIGGELQLNSTFVANDAQIVNLQAGETQLEQLNVNGDGTVNNLNIRQDLTIAGTTRVQGQAVFSQLVTINNNLNVAGNLAIGGTLSARTFEARGLVAGDLLTIGGHIVTRGNPPSLQPGASALGSGGTASVNGTDTAGTVAVNVGTGASTGVLANITFNRGYATIPSVIVSPVGGAMPGLYINRTTVGFTLNTTTALGPGSYAVDFIVMQ